MEQIKKTIESLAEDYINRAKQDDNSIRNKAYRYIIRYENDKKLRIKHMNHFEDCVRGYDEKKRK